jgi:UDP-N-acetylglucosamine 2-epimerase (non-hydrolysing)
MLAFEEICMEVKPALTIVVGDVNSTLAAAVVAAKLGAPVAHVEAGLRSGDRAMPEEINRIVADAVSDYAFVTEQSGVDNLLRENFRAERIFFVGNTMIDSLYFALSKAGESRILEEIGIEGREFALVTLHRPSNVDDARQLGDLAEILLETARRLALVFPLHPRTRQNLERFGLLTALRSEPNIVLTEPLGYIAFVALIRRARFVMTDSGGVQEETTALGVPCLTLRTTTERPVTCELGSNTLVHPSPENIRAALDRELNAGAREFAKPPLWDGKAAERIAEIIASLILP